MKKISLSIIIILASFITTAQNIIGNWKGNLDVQGNEIPIVFHISKNIAAKFIASFDSPNQHAFNMPCSDVIVKEDSVILMMAVLNGKYAGNLSADKKQLTGTWYQNGGSFPLTVNKTSDTATIKEQKRPQTPKPPFAYISEDVEYYNADKSISFGATITHPKSDSNGRDIKAPVYPAVILITGSGQQDRDETIFGHKSFAVIADYLTKKGFVVLRVDDRGIGKTTGIFAESTTADFEKDVEAGIDFLKTRPEVDKQKIGLIGHSEGGMIAPLVADKRSEIKFIILLAAPGIPIINLMAEQSEAIMSSYGNSPQSVKAMGNLSRQIFQELITDKDSSTRYNKLDSIVNNWAKNLDTSLLAKSGFKDSISRAKYIMAQINASQTPWFKYFIAFNPQPYLQKLSCKVLALNGGKDVQVIAKSNLAGIKASLQKSKSPEYDVIEIPGLNHLFQTCIKCNPDEYGELEESFSPKALQIMGDWLKKNVK